MSIEPDDRAVPASDRVPGETVSGVPGEPASGETGEPPSVLWEYRWTLPPRGRRGSAVVVAVSVVAIAASVAGYLNAGVGEPTRWWHLLMASSTVGGLAILIAVPMLARTRVHWQVSDDGTLARRTPRRVRVIDLTSFQRVTVKVVVDRTYMPGTYRAAISKNWVVNCWTRGRARPRKVRLGSIGPESASELTAAIRRARSR